MPHNPLSATTVQCGTVSYGTVLNASGNVLYTVLHSTHEASYHDSFFGLTGRSAVVTTVCDMYSKREDNF